jgi:hypothetical protein
MNNKQTHVAQLGKTEKRYQNSQKNWKKDRQKPSTQSDGSLEGGHEGSMHVDHIA